MPGGGSPGLEIGDLIGKQGPVTPKLFTYLRYNAELTFKGLAELGLADIQPEEVQKIDSVEHIDDLQRIGQAVAQQKLTPRVLPPFLITGWRLSP